ncbi:phosphoglycolate phosphatase-like HAD superfamily hydrolase [Streptomyces sp. 3330]|uniref:SAV_2336 N-terminal domain-related protein n=1 Tax=Streptomyces sp. 3330 TaxID=2817755 RepID=UPI0028580F62|nr:SAV_2336 N-terminal domain-related protein [Streptomyces sp. 3330]MDR6973677.1 phosphoglycolate phosphatase-like HAD superfamily hydrolase [Streptomyces sp. 3330]
MSALDRLTALLTAAADTAPTPRELAELLWLAGLSSGPEEPPPAQDPSDSSAASAASDASDASPDRDTDGTPADALAGPAAGGAGPRSAPVGPADRVPLRLPSPPAGTGGGSADGGAGSRPVLAPAPPMLPHPLALQRALRPLKRTVPSARARLLDERATTDRIARLGAHPDVWLPVLRPARERWLRLNLVHDTGPTMPVWRPLVRELHTVLAQSGVFRAVTPYPATPDGEARRVPHPADGRTVTLIVSDCMGPQWRPGPAGERWYRTLRHWATRMPLAVVQPLPEHLWATTALPAEPGLLFAATRAAPLSALAFSPYDPETAPRPGAALPLPVLEPGAPWLAHWAALVASPGGARTPGAVAWLPPAPLPPGTAGPEAADPAALSAQDLVLRFRATASREAFRLAGHLALAVPSVPVMRLVQRAVNRDPRPQHLAEVILSGLLTTVPGPPGSYDFRPGVRDLLLRTLPRTTRGRTRELLDRIGGLIDERAGLATGGFRAEAGTADGTAGAFATVSAETVRRLGGHVEAPAPRHPEPTAAPPPSPPAERHPRTDRAAPDPREPGRPEPGRPEPGRPEPGRVGDLDRKRLEARQPAAERLEAGPAAAGAPWPETAAAGPPESAHPDPTHPQAGPAMTVRPEAGARRDGASETGAQGRAASDAGAGVQSCLLFETATDLTARPETRITLEYVVHEVLARGDLTPQQYEVHVRPNGYVVRIQPEAFLLPVLAAALRGLPGPLAEASGRPPLRVTFQDGPETPAPPHGAAPVLLTVPPALYAAFADSSAASGPHRFRPLFGDAADAPPLAWYCPLPPEEGAGGGAVDRDDVREPVRGPFLTRDLRQLGVPAPGRTAIVHTGPDSPLALLDPVLPYQGRPPRPATYYEVDLTPRHAVDRISLPGSGKGVFTAAVELTWRVDDPVAFVRAESPGVPERLLAHVREAGSRITRHHSVRRAAGAQRAVNSQLGRWPVPGVAVTCAVTLAPDWAPPPEVRRPADGSARSLQDLLADAETVLFGFDGPLTRLFTATTARAAALDLLRIVAEHRDPEDALAGRPTGDPGAAGRELFVHPLDVLRAFAQDRLGPVLRKRLDRLELDAVPDAPRTHHSVVLVRTLHDTGRRVGVATDVCEAAVHRCLEPYRLPLSAGVHGRDDDLGRLTPNPSRLLHALRPQAAPAAGLLIGSTLAELAAARAAGLRFVGLARNPTVEQALLGAGCDAVVTSLTPVLEAARAL